ncbi:MAG: peptidoglycan DD-metalloendopeptidase family protein [Deltaproteobacteria bacterium]|nr:peptidoglycan DD-metalloendopeptidase family protein [Deltaproteobacteria bacterium]
MKRTVHDEVRFLLKRFFCLLVVIFYVVIFSGFVKNLSADEFEKIENELIRLEDEAGKVKSEIISLEQELESFKTDIEKNRIKCDDIRKEIGSIIKILYFINLEKRLNHFLLKDVETKSIRYGEYIKSLIIRYDENLKNIRLINIEMEKQVEEMNNRLGKLLDKRKVLDKKIEEIYKVMENKNKGLAKIKKEEKKLMLTAKEESLKRIDEVTKQNTEAEKKEGNSEKQTLFRIIWPVRQGDVIREYGGYYDESMNLEKFSRGIVIKAPFLSEVYSVADAKVIFSGWLKGFGNTVILEHSQGFISVYSHLARSEVSKGDIVNERDIIGFVGDTGSNEGVILYFELRKNGKAVDPMNYIR